MSSSYTIFFTNNTVWRWMYENGSIQRSNIRTYGLVLKSAKKIYLWSSSHYPWSIILLGVECSKMVAFNALTSGHMNLWLNRIKKLICDLQTQYSLSITLFGIECTEMVEFNALTSGYMTSCFNQLKKLICNLHKQYSLPIIDFGVEWRKW